MVQQLEFAERGQVHFSHTGMVTTPSIMGGRLPCFGAGCRVMLAPAFPQPELHGVAQHIGPALMPAERQPFVSEPDPVSDPVEREQLLAT